jgi:hypothetical protein
MRLARCDCFKVPQVNLRLGPQRINMESLNEFKR